MDHLQIGNLFSLAVPEEPGDYDQTSIRYTGKNIPSKSFRMLQSMTGGAGADDSPTSSSPGMELVVVGSTWLGARLGAGWVYGWCLEFFGYTLENKHTKHIAS